MLDYDTLFAISMVQTLGRSSRPMRIAEVTSSQNGQLILQELRDAGLVKIYVESSRCELLPPLHRVSLLDIVRAVHGQVEIKAVDKNGKQESLVRTYGEAGIQLEKIRRIAHNMLAAINLYEVWLAPTEVHKKELDAYMQQETS
jgi:DNA-binding IscR family transcriptional regulator